MKTALITGASRGIGRAIAERLAADGYRVIINFSRSEAEAEACAEGIRRRGGEAIALCADVRRSDEVRAMFETVESLYGGAELLVNNAGIAYGGLLCDTTEAEWDDIFAVNVKGAFLCSKAAIPAMLRRQSGAIINISSMWGIAGASCEAAYSASKAALIGLTKALAKELAAGGIRVNCIAPGLIDTQMNAALSEADRAVLIEETPLGRIGRAADIAQAVSFLADAERSGFITGQTLSVDGGFIL